MDSGLTGSPMPVAHDASVLAADRTLKTEGQPRRRPRSAGSGPMVMPLARALELLGAFTPQVRWLGNRDLAERSGLPPSTVTRMTQALVGLGLLVQDPAQRRYRLAAAVLGLGYGAIFNADVQRVARDLMREHAHQHCLQLLLGSRDRLEVIILESASSPQAPVSLDIHAGVRLGIANSVMGWALLAALPELERYYLLEGVQRRMPRDWSRVHRRCSEAMSQVYQAGWCATPAEGDPAIGTIAAPLLVEGHAPLVLACVGASQHMTRARIERELGPRLLDLASRIQQVCQERP